MHKATILSRNGKGDGVSIPFKRESIYARALETYDRNAGGFVFQFPSNGKAYMHAYNTAQGRLTLAVSIPFKRESIYAPL